MAAKVFERKIRSRKVMAWLAALLYVALLLFIWFDYSMELTGQATLEGALFFTVFTPLVAFAGFKIYQIRSLRFWKLLWTAFGATVFGFLIWSTITFVLNRVLSLSAWTGAPSVLLTYMTLSYLTGAYLGYRFGKKRGFMPPLFQG